MEHKTNKKEHQNKVNILNEDSGRFILNKMLWTKGSISVQTVNTH